jgi:hypothetical protein
VKELLGHANIAVTANIYTHTRLPRQADAFKQLDTQLDEPVLRPRKRRGAAPESGVETDGAEDPPSTSTDHIS